MNSSLGFARHHSGDNSAVFIAIMFYHIIKHLVAARTSEIHVDVRNTCAARIQETFKHQTVLNGVCLADIQQVGYQ